MCNSANLDPIELKIEFRFCGLKSGMNISDLNQKNNRKISFKLAKNINLIQTKTELEFKETYLHKKTVLFTLASIQTQIKFTKLYIGVPNTS